MTTAATRIDLVFAREAKRLDTIAKEMGQTRRRALATLTRRLPVAWRRDLQETYNLPAAQIRDRISYEVGGDSVLITGRARPVGLVNFGGRWTSVKSPGAAAQVFVAKGRHIYGGTFIAVGRSGNRQIFERKGKARLPIRALYGPSVASMFRNKDRQQRMYIVAQSIFAAEIARLTKTIDQG